MKQKESDLYPPVRDWLERQGYKVYVEQFGVDVIGLRDSTLVVVELKLCLTHRLRYQLQVVSGWADFVYGAVPTVPRLYRGLRHEGFGLLIVRGGKVYQRIKAQQQPFLRERKRAYRFKQLAGRGPALHDELAGLPCCPELREQRRRHELAIQAEQQALAPDPQPLTPDP